MKKKTKKEENEGENGTVQSVRGMCLTERSLAVCKCEVNYS